MKGPRERKRREEDYLRDILKFGQQAVDFCQGKSFREFEESQSCLYACMYCLQVVGEASSQLTEETRSKIKGIPWKSVRGMRNILVHAYHNADNEVIYLTIKNRLPELMKLVKAYLKEVAKSK